MNIAKQFNGYTIRKEWHNEEWYFSIVDIVAALSGSNNPRRYWSDLKSKLKREGAQVYETIVHLKMIAPDGRNRSTDCANRQTIFRIVQSISSPNAEPFKDWLAQLGEERLEEIEDPAKAMDRVRQNFRDLGYSDEWIETRIRTKEGRIELTNEWKKRGIADYKEYQQLTAILSAGTFGLIPSDHKRVKGLGKENLRDHMTREELIFTELAEMQTKRETIDADAQGFQENRIAAVKGGRAAGKARTAFEQETGQRVVSPTNFLKQIFNAKKKKKLDKGAS